MSSGRPEPTAITLSWHGREHGVREGSGYLASTRRLDVAPRISLAHAATEGPTRPARPRHFRYTGSLRRSAGRRDAGLADRAEVGIHALAEGRFDLGGRRLEELPGPVGLELLAALDGLELVVQALAGLGVAAARRDEGPGERLVRAVGAFEHRLDLAELVHVGFDEALEALHVHAELLEKLRINLVAADFLLGLVQRPPDGLQVRHLARREEPFRRVHLAALVG